MFDYLTPNSPSKHDISIVDYRNSKYQGELNPETLQREGVGMCLDHNYLLALGKWKRNVLEGDCFIVYPDRTVFIGRMRQQFPEGLCVFMMENGQKIYCNFNQNGVNHTIL